VHLATLEGLLERHGKISEPIALLPGLDLRSDVNQAWRVKAKTKAKTSAGKPKTQAKTSADKAKTQAKA